MDILYNRLKSNYYHEMVRETFTSWEDYLESVRLQAREQLRETAALEEETGMSFTPLDKAMQGGVGSHKELFRKVEGGKNQR
jgi:hypothetical protein